MGKILSFGKMCGLGLKVLRSSIWGYMLFFNVEERVYYLNGIWGWCFIVMVMKLDMEKEFFIMGKFLVGSVYLVIIWSYNWKKYKRVNFGVLIIKGII